MVSERGVPCGSVHVEAFCNSQRCPIHCEVTDFGVWSLCSKSCGGGLVSRNRTVKVHPNYGGNSCPPLVERERCNTHHCPVNCKVSKLSTWSPCSASCDYGYKVRHRAVLEEPKYNGTACPALIVKKSCINKPCAVDCTVSPWSPFTPCSSTCGKTGRRLYMFACSYVLRFFLV